MSRLIIDGGVPLSGTIRVQGAKNAVLPILAATVITNGECVIRNCPQLRDVDKTDLVLERLGCSVERSKNTVTVNPNGFCSCEICERCVRQSYFSER